MNRRDESRQKADAKRRKLVPWRRWYFTKGWKSRSKRQLAKVAWCEPCRRLGRSRKATTADHKEPHRGDREKFFHGELESQCDNCHSQAKQREELEGFNREITDEGWPIDPRHPFNLGADPHFKGGDVK